MKLRDWARRTGVSYQTAWRWFKAGKLPVPARQTATGMILVEEPPAGPPLVAIYARVSSADQKPNLDAQVARLLEQATAQGWAVGRVVTEIGSGLNGHRPRLKKLLADPKVGIVLVEHRDRLMRFGAEYVESALAASGRRLMVADPSERKDDLVQDMIEVLTSFCARLYGRRSARNKAERAMEALKEPG